MDKISPQRRSANMARIKSKGTKPEMAVRSLVHRLGYRFRLHRKNLPGNPDLVFPARNAVIFVHGCFWHQHPDPDCKDARPPKSRQEYWAPKLARNIARDEAALSALGALGWHTMVIWECETQDLQSLSIRICNFLGLCPAGRLPLLSGQSSPE